MNLDKFRHPHPRKEELNVSAILNSFRKLETEEDSAYIAMPAIARKSGRWWIWESGPINKNKNRGIANWLKQSLQKLKSISWDGIIYCPRNGSKKKGRESKGLWWILPGAFCFCIERNTENNFFKKH